MHTTRAECVLTVSKVEVKELDDIIFVHGVDRSKCHGGGEWEEECLDLTSNHLS